MTVTDLFALLALPQVVYSCYFCAGTPEDDPFSTFSPQLLDSYGNLQYISLLYDDVLPAAVLAVRSVYGSGSFLARVVTEGGSAFISDSPTITEERLNVTSGTGNTRPTVEARSSGHKELSAISVCCGQDGAVSQVAFRFSDGSMSSAGSCPGTSPSGALALQQGDAGAGVALPLTGGGAVAVPAGSGFRLSGVRGSRGAAVGAVSFAFARKLNREWGLGALMSLAYGGAVTAHTDHLATCERLPEPSVHRHSAQLSAVSPRIPPAQPDMRMAPCCRGTHTVLEACMDHVST